MQNRKARKQAAARLASIRDNYLAQLRSDIRELLELTDGFIETCRDEVNSQCVGTLDDIETKLARLATKCGTFGLTSLRHSAELLAAEIASLPRQDTIDQQTLESIVLELEAMPARLLESEEELRNEVAPIVDHDGNSSLGSLIWIVDRDPLLRDFAQRQLISQGFRVETFEDLPEEPPLLDEEPDCLLIDETVRRPINDEHPQGVPWIELLKPYRGIAIFMGSREDFESRIAAERAGAKSYIAKPLDIPRLATRISFLLKDIQQPRERILLISCADQPSDTLASDLEAARMEVHLLSASERLVHEVARVTPDLVIIDSCSCIVGAPDLVGVLRQFMRWAGLPIIVLVDEDDPVAIEAAMSRGADSAYRRSSSRDTLVRIIRASVRRARDRDALVMRDGLTGLLKQTAILDAYFAAHYSAIASSNLLSVVMLDIDHFKSVNDIHGHAVGDLVISTVASILREQFRSTDYLGRYGGEEFMVVLPKCSEEKAFELVEGVREAFNSVHFVGRDGAFAVSLSAGISSTERLPKLEARSLLAAADDALYEAKRAGRNRVRVALNASLRGGDEEPSTATTKPALGGTEETTPELAASVQKTHELLTHVFATTDAAVTILNEEGYITFASPSAEALLGLELSDSGPTKYATPRWHIESVDGGPFPARDLPFAQLQRSGQPIRDIRHALRWPDGTRQIVSVNGNALDPHIYGSRRFIFTTTDITDLIETGEALRDEKRKLDKLIDRVPGALYICIQYPNGEFSFPFKGPLFNALVGESHNGERISEPYCFRNAAREDRQALSLQIASSAARLTPLNKEFRVRDLSGQLRWLEVNAIPERQSDGSTRWYGYLDDISSRKEIELTLEEREQRFRMLFEFSPIGVTLNDLETGQFIAANAAFSQQTGYDKAELLELKLSSLSPREFEPQDHEQLSALKTRHRYGPYEKELTRKDGSRYPVRQQGFLLRDSSDKLMVWSLFEDISDAKRGELLKQEFISTVNHELRSPLTAIADALTLISTETHKSGTQKASELIKIAKQNTEQLTELVDDLLSIEELDNTGIELSPERLDLDQLLNDISRLHTPTAERKNIEIVTLASADSPSTAQGDTSHDKHLVADKRCVVQILTNLVSNALKFSSEGSRIELSYEQSPDHTTLLVQDYDEGIAPALRPNLFQRFTKASAADTRRKRGTGLGLAIAQELSQLMGGTITYETEVAKGTLFRVNLPRHGLPAGDPP